MDKGYYNNKINELKEIFGDIELIDESTIIINQKKRKIINDVIIYEELESINDLNKKSTIGSFGQEWIEFNDIKNSHFNEFNMYFDKIDLYKLNKKIIADIGCGNGRWSYILLQKCKPRNILLIDPSDSIFVARKNISSHDNAIYLKADIEKINLRRESIDFSYCIGVLHHLPQSLLINDISLRNIRNFSRETLYYLYHGFDGRGFIFKTIYKISNQVRLFLSPIKSFFFKNIISYFLVIIFYYPFILLNRLASTLFILNPKFPLFFYTFLNFQRIRQDAYDKFFTPSEFRYDKEQIKKAFSKYYNNLVFSNHTPRWHFLAFNYKSEYLLENRKKVLLVTQGYKGGGAQKILHELLNIDNKNLDIKIIYIDENISGIQNSKIMFTGSKRNRNSLIKLFNIINTENPDTIMSTLTIVDSLVVLINLFKRKKYEHIVRLTVVMSEHYKRFRFFLIYKFIIRLIYRYPKKFVCMSDDMIFDLSKNYSVKKSKIIKINNFINKEELQSTNKLENEQNKFICLGRIHPQKGYGKLIDSLKYTDKNFKIKIYGWGDNALLSHYKKKVMDYNLQDCISFEGRIDSLRDVMNEAHALLLPSLYEGFPNVALEALAFGKPVLALPFKGGINEIIISGINGRIANEHSVEALADLITKFNPLDYNEKIVQSTVGKFEKSRALEKYKSLLTNV